MVLQTSLRALHASALGASASVVVLPASLSSSMGLLALRPPCAWLADLAPSSGAPPASNRSASPVCVPLGALVGAQLASFSRRVASVELPLQPRPSQLLATPVESKSQLATIANKEQHNSAVQRAGTA